MPNRPKVAVSIFLLDFQSQLLPKILLDFDYHFLLGHFQHSKKAGLKIIAAEFSQTEKARKIIIDNIIKTTIINSTVILFLNEINFIVIIVNNIKNDCFFRFSSLLLATHASLFFHQQLN